MAKRQQTVRVVGGELRGRALRYPDSRAIRPTMQRTKEALFNMLGDMVEGSVFVDLFAGAGGMGIEALSRGAKRVHLVESDREATQFLRDNLRTCDVGPDRYEVHALDVFDFLTQQRVPTHDIVFADPPYELAQLSVLLELLGRIDYAPDSLLLFEHEKNIEVKVPPLIKLREKSFGQTVVSFFSRPQGDAS